MNSSFRSFIFNILISCLFSNEVCINLSDEDEMPSISSKVDEEDFVICSVPHQEISPHIAVSMKDWKTLEKGTWIRDGMIFCDIYIYSDKISSLFVHKDISYNGLIFILHQVLSMGIAT